MPRAFLSAAVVVLLLSPNASAQHRAIVAPGPSDLLRAPIAVDTVPRRIQPTHWKEGALIGGLAGGIGLALVASDLCRYSDAGGSCTISVPAGFMLGGFIGGSLGALIGGQISKKEDPPGR